MIIERLEVGAFAENCYLVGCKSTKAGVIIDPGDEIDRILKKLDAMQLQIKYILITHAHLDHIKELKVIQEKINVPTLMNKKDEFLLENLPAQASAFGLSCSGIPKIDRYIQAGDTVQFGNIKFDVLETPGHSPGSVTFHTYHCAFVGDVLFSGSIGRTDLPGGDYDILIDSIKRKLFPLGNDLQVFPGHGPSTNIGIEKTTNPFLIQG